MENQELTSGAPPVPPAGSALPPAIGGWMTFVALITIIGGGFNVLTCVGIPFGVLMIVGGVALWGARNVLLGIREVDPALEPFFRKMKTYMLMTGIGYLLGIVITIVMVIVYFGVIVAALASGEF